MNGGQFAMRHLLTYGAPTAISMTNSSGYAQVNDFLDSELLQTPGAASAPAIYNGKGWSLYTNNLIIGGYSSAISESSITASQTIATVASNNTVTVTSAFFPLGLQVGATVASTSPVGALPVGDAVTAFNIQNNTITFATAPAASSTTVTLALNPLTITGSQTEYYTGLPTSLFNSAATGGRLNIPWKEFPVPGVTPVSIVPQAAQPADGVISGAIDLTATDPTQWTSELATCTSNFAYVAPGTIPVATGTTIHVTIPDCIYHIQLYGVSISGTIGPVGSSPASSNLEWDITGTTTATAPVILENCYLNCTMVHTGNRAVAVKDGDLAYTSAPGAGDLFTDDVQFTNLPLTLYASQHHYGWQVDIEGTGNKLVSNGAVISWLGFKTERLGVPASLGQLNAGSVANIYNFHAYPISCTDSGSQPTRYVSTISGVSGSVTSGVTSLSWGTAVSPAISTSQYIKLAGVTNSGTTLNGYFFASAGGTTSATIPTPNEPNETLTGTITLTGEQCPNVNTSLFVLSNAALATNGYVNFAGTTTQFGPNYWVTETKGGTTLQFATPSVTAPQQLNMFYSYSTHPGIFIGGAH